MAKRKGRKARQRVRKIVQRAAKDNKITRKEVKRIKRISKKANVSPKFSKKTIKKVAKRTTSKIGKGVAKGFKIKKGVDKINTAAKDARRTERKDDRKADRMADRLKRISDRKKINKQERKKERVKEQKKDAIEESLADDKKEQVSDIEDASSKDSKKYQKFDYEKELKDGAKRVRSKDEDARKDMPRPERLSLKKGTEEKIAKKTGYDKIKDRIKESGKLESKKNALKAVRPDFKKHQKALGKIESPYKSQLKKIGRKTGVEYGDKERSNRTKSRLKSLAGKLNPSSKSPFGSTKNKRSGYGDAGSDLLKKFSDSKKRKPSNNKNK